MAEPTSQNAIIVLKESIDHEDPGEIVGSNVWFVNALTGEHLGIDDIAEDAFRSYYVDYYLAQFHNGGFSQFVYNSRWSSLVIQFIRDGMKAMGAVRQLEVFEKGVKLVEAFGQERLQNYFASEYFGENADRDELNSLNGDFWTAEETEDLLALNAAWLRNHPNLCPMATEEAMLQEARRRGLALPDRDERIAEARASEPQYMKLIRTLCEKAGQELERVTAGDPIHEYEGNKILAWHFITNRGHHHMIQINGLAIMFREFSTTDRVCEIEASED